MNTLKKILLLVFASVLITGCNQTSQNQIEIGCILPLTGYGAANGNMCKEGLELAVQEINNQKLIKDGQLFILRDGKTYSVQG